MAEFERCAPDDPHRCQAVGALGQCPYKAIGYLDEDNQWVGIKNCPRHATHFTYQQDRLKHRMYFSAQWQARIGSLADHPKYRSIREEIGIARMTLENRLNLCKDERDLAMHTGAIVEILREIGRLSKIAAQIEVATGQMMTKDEAEIWVSKIIEIIGHHVHDPAIIQKISDEILDGLKSPQSSSTSDSSSPFGPNHPCLME